MGCVLSSPLSPGCVWSSVSLWAVWPLPHVWHFLPRARRRVPSRFCIGSKMLAADKLLLQSNVKQRSIELREKEVCASQKEACCNVEPCHVCW